MVGFLTDSSKEIVQVSEAQTMAVRAAMEFFSCALCPLSQADMVSG